MNRFSLVALCVAVALGTSGCKIVKDVPDDEKAIAADASGDDARTAQRLDETFDSELLPYIADHAIAIATLREALAGGLDAAGAAHGNQGSGEGAAWNFPVNGEGVVTAAKLDTRARTAELDTDGDGTADVTLQLGPVLKGSALRDVAPFFKFDDFRDQIEFAKLARALNDRIKDKLVVPEGDLVGKQLAFTGVVALKTATEALLVTPIKVEVMP